MKRFFATVSALALLASPALAQRQPAYQSGTASPNDIAKFTAPGQVTKSGGLNGDANGAGVNPYAITDKHGCGLQFNTDKTTVDTNQSFCIGHRASDSEPVLVRSDGTEYLLAQPQIAPSGLPQSDYVVPWDFDPLCDGRTMLSDYTNQVAHDCADAINAAAAVSVNGGRATVKLQTGYYYVKSAIGLNRQALRGTNDSSTYILVDDKFDPNALGVIVPSDGTYPASGNIKPSEITGLSVHFQQPADQGSRSNFLPLSGGCTSLPGGSGCQYPPAIYNTSARVKIDNVQIQAAWTGIYYHSDAPRMSDINISALNVGIDLDNSRDFGYIYHFEMHNAFGLCGFFVGDCNLNNVYYDGNTYGAKIGAADGSNFSDFRFWRTRLVLTNNFSNGNFSNISMDGNNASIRVDHTNDWGARFTGGYTNGSAVGGDTDCSLDVRGGLVTVSGMQLNAGPLGLCVDGGTVNWSGGIIRTLDPATDAVHLKSGVLSITGALITTATTGPYTISPIRQEAAGALHFVGNKYLNAPVSGSVPALALQDNADNYVADNNFGTWVPMNGASFMTLGYYDTGDYRWPMTVTPKFTTLGDFAASLGSNTQIAYFYRQGSHVVVDWNMGFDTNAYTTATDAFYLELDGPPEGLVDALGDCGLQVIAKVTYTNGDILGCAVGRFGGFEAVNLTRSVSNASLAGWTTTNIPPSTTGIMLKGHLRYRVR